MFTLINQNPRTFDPKRPLSKRLKIALLYPNLGIGGVEKILLEHARIYHEFGFEIILITDSVLEREYPCPKYIKRINLDARGLNLNQRLNQFLVTLLSLRVDLVINHLSYDLSYQYFLVITRLLGIPWVQWQHYNSLRLTNYYINFINDYFAKSSSLTSAYVCLTRFDTFVQKASGISNAICIPNPVIMKPVRAQYRQSISRIPRLLWIGRLDDSVKRISELPLILQEIVKTLPSVHLDIVGPETASTPNNFQVQFYSRGLKQNVTFHGSKTAQELAEFYWNADLFIFTSITEGSPNVLLEASAYGLPIVMYELPWLPIVQNNLGCIQVPQSDRKAFSRSIVKLLNAPAAYAASSQAALGKVEELKRIDVPQMLLDLVHNRIAPPIFSVQEQAEYAEIMARFMGYNAIRNSEAKAKSKRELDVDLTWLLSREADAAKALIISKGDLELDKLRLERQFGILRKVRSGLGRIKRKIVSFTCS
jgi:glycosyltransferase involved in cell wall biosynthesis